MSSPSSTGASTPTHTVATDDLNHPIVSIVPGPTEHTSDVPWHDQTFAILHRPSRRAIVVTSKGHVRLRTIDNVDLKESSWWTCVEENGWLGFLHEGRYLSRTDSKGLKLMDKMREHEWFMARAHPDGGYQLMSLHRAPWNEAWWFLDVAGDGEGLVEVEKRGALWDFIKV